MCCFSVKEKKPDVTSSKLDCHGLNWKYGKWIRFCYFDVGLTLWRYLHEKERRHKAFILNRGLPSFQMFIITALKRDRAVEIFTFSASSTFSVA